MRKELVAVTIPIYKPYPDANELISLNQTIKVLNRYPIIFFAPQSLDTSFYENHCTNKINFKIKKFANDYFDGIRGYNKLMLSKEFYLAFNNYKYILICQLDAYVFRDELEYWCNKGYDYIGAPYLFVDIDKYPIKILTRYRHFLKILNSLNIIKYTYKHTGNGGFSLRNVSKTIRFLKIFSRLIKRWRLNEDSLFTHYGNLIFPLFKLAPEDEALRFAFENNPDKAYEINHEQLPFGCHAFSTPKNRVFWSKYIHTEILNQ